MPRLAIPAALIFLLMTAPLAVGAPPSGGGTVNNVLPVPASAASQSSSGDAASTFNEGTAGILAASLQDRNGERTLAAVKVDLVQKPAGVSFTAAEHTVTSSEAGATTAPASFGADAFRVWSGPTARDGLLQVQYQYTYPVAGTYTWRVFVKDQANAYQSDAARDVTVSVVVPITVLDAPVDATGDAQEGTRWGSWTANPAATNVPSTNYLKITNSGATAGQQVTITFTGTFTGQTDPTDTIPVVDNIEFATYLDTNPATTEDIHANLGAWSAPASGASGKTFTLGAAGGESVLYVAYRILELPDLLVAQVYSNSITVVAT